MHGIRRSSLSGNLELGNLLLSRVARRVRGNGADSMSSMNMTLVSFGRMIVEGFDDEIGVNLVVISYDLAIDGCTVDHMLATSKRMA